MKIAAIQMDIALGELDKNYAAAGRMIGEAALRGADTIVLSELWNTSFYPINVMELADVDGIRTKSFLAEFAGKYGVNIVGGSVANCHDGALYNTTFIVDRQGHTVASYDKAHLFSPSKENDVFSAGSHVNLFMLDNIPMASIICYDLRFCEWVRQAALAGAQMLFVPAAWPDRRVTHWQILNRARAIENQFYVTAVNSCGFAGDLRFGGHSMVINPWGDVLAEGGDGETIVMADVDFGTVQKIRESINVFKDRRPEIYK